MVKGRRVPRPGIPNLTARIGHRGAILLALAFIDGIYGAALLNHPPAARTQPVYVWIAGLAPLPVWGGLWLAVAVVCAVFAFMERDAPAFTAAMALKVVWGTLAGAGWVLGEVPRGYVSMAIWYFAAFIVGITASWPEPVPPAPQPSVDLPGKGRRWWTRRSL